MFLVCFCVLVCVFILFEFLVPAPFSTGALTHDTVYLVQVRRPELVRGHVCAVPADVPRVRPLHRGLLQLVHRRPPSRHVPLPARAIPPAHTEIQGTTCGLNQRIDSTLELTSDVPTHGGKARCDKHCMCV